jgi:uncharacterized protein
MLFNTFVHIPGIGEATERSLWEAGILSWDAFPAEGPDFLPRQKANLIRAHLARGRRDLSSCLPQLPAAQRWRIFPHFRHTAAYVDIETTGLSFAHSEITTIALYDGSEVFTYVRGENLHRFAEDIEGYGLLVTYNGAAFDLPMLRRQLGVRLPQPHLDLGPLMHGLGFRGGLKGCERQLGLERGELAGVDGLFAVRLWEEYRRRGDLRLLETLLAYNIEDTVNLEILLVKAYNLKIQDTPFAGSHRLPLPVLPERRFFPDRDLLSRLLAGRGGDSAGRWAGLSCGGVFFCA